MSIPTIYLKKITIKKTRNYEIEKKILDHDHDTYIATQEFNKLTLENFDERWIKANLASKYDIADFVKKKILMIN